MAFKSNAFMFTVRPSFLHLCMLWKMFYFYLHALSSNRNPFSNINGYQLEMFWQCQYICTCIRVCMYADTNLYLPELKWLNSTSIFVKILQYSKHMPVLNLWHYLLIAPWEKILMQKLIFPKNLCNFQLWLCSHVCDKKFCPQRCKRFLVCKKPI